MNFQKWELLSGSSGSLGTYRQNEMLAKVHIVIPIEKQTVSGLRNHFPFLDSTSLTQDIEMDVWTDFNYNTLLFLCFVDDGFAACRSQN